ncbi:MAG: hypothetical protein KAJ24_04925 [Candidatus Aenigmarchaeota archaeon]|nr:hypothetical protein [Candidatus Aenigmarchaeota archaeon]
MSSKYILVFALVFTVLALGCVSDNNEQDAPYVEPLDEGAISSVDTGLDALVSDMDDSSEIAAELEDGINVDDLEIVLE